MGSRTLVRFACLTLLVVAATLVAAGSAFATSSDWAAIYYAPHPDDDALGMAHSIKAHLEAGRPVYVVLFTDGEASAVRTSWLADSVPGSLWVDYDLDGTPCQNDFALARREEFRQSMVALGVPEANLRYLGRANPNGPELLPTTTGTGSQFADGGLDDRYQDVKNVMHGLHSQYTVYDGSGNVLHTPSHKTVMRYNDPAGTTYDTADNIDHLWAATALNYKCDTYGWDGRFYKVYAYGTTPRYANYKESGTTAQHAAKQKALNCYDIGHYSVNTVWHGAYDDLYEYMAKSTDW